MAGIRLTVPESLQDPTALQTQVSLSGAGKGLDEGESMKDAGEMLAWGGAALGAVAGYFEAMNRQAARRMQAMGLEFQGTMADANARQAELEARLLIESGNEEISARSMRYGQEKAQQKVNAARRGVIATAGSAAEVRASMELARRMEARTIRRNARRASDARRTSALNSRNQARLARAAAANARAGGPRPELVALSAAGNAFMRGATAIGE